MSKLVKEISFGDNIRSVVDFSNNVKKPSEKPLKPNK